DLKQRLEKVEKEIKAKIETLTLDRENIQKMLSEITRLYKKMGHYEASLKMYQLLLKPNLGATDAQKTEANEEIPKLRKKIEQVQEQIQSQITSLGFNFNPPN